MDDIEISDELMMEEDFQYTIDIFGMTKYSIFNEYNLDAIIH